MLIKLFRTLVGFAAVALAVLPAPSSLGQVANAHQIVPGWLDLEITRDGSSSLDFELLELGTHLCGTPWFSGSSGGSEECRIVFGAGGRLSGTFAASPLRLEVLSATAFTNGSGLVSVRPQALEISYPDTLATPCGDFHYTLTIATGPQPTSMLTLLPPSSVGANTSLVAGTLEIRAMVAFSPVVEVGERTPVHSEQLVLNLDFGGRWTVVSPSHPLVSNLVGQGSTNLTLFADRANPMWVPRPACGQDKKKCSRFCLEATEERLDILSFGNDEEVEPTE